jgi:hypothetical protein
MSAQPDQALRRDDCSTPNEGPFLATNVFVVEVFGKIISQEDRPDDNKGPNVGMQGEWHFFSG